jgi:hypothetical protein
MAKRVVWFLFVLLFFLHQDFWWWDQSFLVLGFLPVGLAYHAMFSIACSILGWLAIRYAWPKQLEEMAESTE